jgi:hypothetical protein
VTGLDVGIIIGSALGVYVLSPMTWLAIWRLRCLRRRQAVPAHGSAWNRNLPPIEPSEPVDTIPSAFLRLDESRRKDDA